MASDAVFSCSKGSVHPWKHQALVSELGTLTGSKSVLTILNCLDHSINCDDMKWPETEVACFCTSGQQAAQLVSVCADLATGYTI